MKNKNPFSFITPKRLVWLIILGLAALLFYFAYYDYISYWWLIIPIPIAMVAFYDSYIQKTHTLLTNYPLISRLRYFLESFRPEVRQYFFEGELDGKPFNRRQRSIVYQRSKNVRQTVSFGMQDDPEKLGYEWGAHSIYTKEAKPENFRVNIGNAQCSHPYSLSVLNISAMSYGALSKSAITALNKGAELGQFAHNTGEGGISDYHLQGADLIWQIGTGYFGCRNDDATFSAELFKEKSALPNVKMIELKISQGAKPGHGGLLPAEKNTEEISKIRHIPAHTTIHSPTAHSSFSDAEGLLHFLQKLRTLSGGKPVGFKICIGRKDEFKEIIDAIDKLGIIPDFITIDGAEGGTGAAPLEFIDNFGMALSDAVSFVNLELKNHGLRDKISILASGKIITAFDIAKVIALGANACYSARGMMFSLGCIQALQCDSGKCPVGIATQDKSTYKGLDITNKSVRVASYHKNTLSALAEFIGACGAEQLHELNPDYFYKRTGYNENRSFKEIYGGK